MMGRSPSPGLFQGWVWPPSGVCGTRSLTFWMMIAIYPLQSSSPGNQPQIPTLGCFSGFSTLPSVASKPSLRARGRVFTYCEHRTYFSTGITYPKIPHLDFFLK